MHDVTTKNSSQTFCFTIQLYQEAENILIESKDIIQELIGYKGQFDKVSFNLQVHRTIQIETEMFQTNCMLMSLLNDP